MAESTSGQERKRRFAAMWGGLILLTLIFVFVLSPTPAALVPTLLLLWIWPIVPWALLIPGPLTERLALSAGWVLFLNSFGSLLLTYIPGPITSWWLFLLATAANLIPLLIGLFSRDIRLPNAGKELRQINLTLVLLLFLGLTLRMANFSYKELQGDEGVVLVRAAGSLTGDDTELFLHQKGPMEIVLPMVGWGIAGTIDDMTARLPFLWASFMGLLVIYLVTKHWFGEKAGLLACLLFGINGFGLAFGRIVQYQALVILWSMLALLAATRYRENGRTRDLFASVIFICAGVLAHYDALLFTPAVVWLLIMGYTSGRNIRWREIIIAGSLGLLLILAFYGPYVLNENFNQTLNYLLDVRVGTGGGRLPFGWSGPQTWRMATFYNSTWYVLGVLILGGIGIGRLIKNKQGLPAILVFSVPGAFYLFIVQDPRTHVYTLFPGLCMLASFGTLALWNALKNRATPPVIWLVKGVGIVWLLIVTAYPYLLFVDISVERQRNWAESRPLTWLYPVTWKEPPKYGLFGFPHQAGWRIVPDMMTDKILPYMSNEEEEITNFYMLQDTRTYCQDARSVIRVANAQDEIPLPDSFIDNFFLQARVTVNGEPTLSLYSQEEISEPLVFEARGTRRWVTPDEARAPEPLQYSNVGQLLGDKIRLLGYEIDDSQVDNDGYLGVILYWEALHPIERNYQVFVHLLDDALITQHDGAPECAMNPTSHWEAGEIIRDPHYVPIPDDIPGGSYRLEAGMYDLLSLERLAVQGESRDSIFLTELIIESD